MDLLPIFSRSKKRESGLASAPRSHPVINRSIRLGHRRGQLLVDLRLLGFGFVTRSPGSRATPSPGCGRLIVMLATCMPFSESVKCYYSPAFWFKMEPLALAIVFTFTVRRKVVPEEGRVGALWSRVRRLPRCCSGSGWGPEAG
jgi:hypothetical protein